MAKGRRGFGAINGLPSGRFRARYADPEGRTVETKGGKIAPLMHSAPHTFDTKLDAEAWLTDERRMISAGTWTPPAARTAAKREPSMTVRTFADRWLSERTGRGGEPLKDRTRDHYRQLLDQHILPVLGELTVKGLTRDDVADWYAGMDPSKKTTRAHAYVLLRSIFASAADPDEYALRPDNPVKVRNAPTSASKKRKIEPATLEELATLTEAMPERYQPMVQLACWCAMRFGELTELRRKDVLVTKNLIRVRRGVVRSKGEFVVTTPKSDAGSRDVNVPPHLMPMIRAHLTTIDRSPNALLFPAASDPNKHLAPASFYKVYYPARESAGRPDLRFHDLRHTGAVWAAQTGATLAELMARLGHSTSQAAMRYQHAAKDRDAQIAGALSDMVTKRLDESE